MQLFRRKGSRFWWCRGRDVDGDPRDDPEGGRRAGAGDGDRLVFGVVGNQGKHRAEGFFASGQHIVADIREYRGLDVVTFIEPFRSLRAPDQQARTLIDAALAFAPALPG